MALRVFSCLCEAECRVSGGTGRRNRTKEMAKKKDDASAAKSEVLTYRGEGISPLSVMCDGETVWLTQQQMAALFGVQKAAISKHVKNIFAIGELAKRATVSKMETVQSEGGRSIVRSLVYYNLDMIISVGYRVNSIKGVRFRQWATKVLRTILLNGVKRDFRMEALEHRVALTEKGLKRVEEGLGYIAEQLAAPEMEEHKRIEGFAAK